MASKNTYTISKKVTSTAHGENGPIGEWAVWVDHDEQGIGDTSDIPAAGDIDIDNDGVFGTRHRAVIDLSHGLGQALGKQLPMTAIYRVKGIKVGIRPVDDTIDNSQGGVMFGGNIKYVFPNKHNIDAIQAARKVERLAESRTIDADSDVFGTERSGYNGFRFGWRTESDVYMATREGFSSAGEAVDGGVSSWCLYSDDGALGILDNYATWKGLVPQLGTEHRNLWNTRCGSPSKMMWNCTWVSDSGAQGQADFHKQWGAENHLPVLGGLLVLDVIYSSTDQPATPSGSDDDYVVFVEVDVEGWEAF